MTHPTAWLVHPPTQQPVWRPGTRHKRPDQRVCTQQGFFRHQHQPSHGQGECQWQGHRPSVQVPEKPDGDMACDLEFLQVFGCSQRHCAGRVWGRDVGENMCVARMCHHHTHIRYQPPTNPLKLEPTIKELLGASADECHNSSVA